MGFFGAFAGRAAKPAQRIEPTLPVPAEAAATPPRVRNSAASTYPLSDPDAWDKLFGAQRHNVSADTAMTQSVFYACVSLIAGQISALPIRSYRVDADEREIERSGPLAKLFDNPNPRYSRVTFWRNTVANMLMNGNGIAWIERRGATPVALWSIPWGRAGVQFYTPPGGGAPRLLYHLRMDNGQRVVADQDDVLHIPGSVVWNLFYSVSPLTAYALSVGIALNADKFADAYFRNSSSPDGYITIPQALKGGSDQADEYRKRWTRRFAGEDRFSGPAVLDQGAKFETLRINAADAQLLESRAYNAIDISRIFHVPPHLVNAHDKAAAFGKSLEEQNQGFLDYALAPHLDAIEAELKRKLYSTEPDRFAEFDREQLMRGDLKSRSESDARSLGGAQGPGWLAVNEVRRKRGLPSLPGEEFDTPLQWGAQAPSKPESGKADPAPAAPKGPKGPAKKNTAEKG